jgi:translation elongation factor EF-Tu-like GTPase
MVQFWWQRCDDPMPQTREHILLARRSASGDFFNKVDLVDDPVCSTSSKWKSATCHQYQFQATKRRHSW